MNKMCGKWYCFLIVDKRRWLIAAFAKWNDVEEVKFIVKYEQDYKTNREEKYC